jgi:hypothetical protein
MSSELGETVIGRWWLCGILAYAGAGTALAQETAGHGPSFSALLGTVTVGEAQWQRLDLQPRFRSGKLEAVFDLELFMDQEGRFRDLGWDFSSRRKGLESLFRKIHTIRYGRVEDPQDRVYVKIGDLSSVTLGQGLIMRDYRNTLGAPGEKRTGLDLQIRGLAGGRLTIRGVVNHLLDLDGGGPVGGGRVQVAPPGPLTVGATVVVDTDQLSGLPDSLRADLDKDPYGAFGVDVSYPLVDGPRARVRLYGEASRALQGPGSGTGLSGPGLQVTLGGLSFQGEYRWIRGHFSPAYFDALYELRRAAVDTAGAIVTGEAAVTDMTLRGIFGDLRLSMGPLLQAGASYQHLTGRVARDRRLEARASLGSAMLKAIPRVSLVEAYYENHRREDGDRGFFEASPSMRYGYRFGFEPVGKVSVIWEVEFTYQPDGIGGFERRRLLNLQSLINL